MEKEGPGCPPESSRKKDILNSLNDRKIGNTVDWRDGPFAWGCLESLVSTTESKFLSKKSYLCGNNQQNCDVVLQHPLISPKHCRIFLKSVCGDAPQYCIKNFSIRGTYVNDKRLERNETAPLVSWDIIRFTVTKSPRVPVFRFRCRAETERFEKTYTLGPLVGSGFCGKVYQATHKPTSSRRAVKLIDGNKLLSKPMALEHLRNEVDILLTLGPHPCVVEVFEVYEESLFIYIAFEFVEFGDLFDLVSTETPSEAETRFIHKQLLEATKFMHGEGVVHRDIKPENVLVADKAKFHMKLTDFGLAKVVQQADEPLTTRCGTLAYAAPEVLGTSEQKQYDKGCDLWSLGAVLYVCLCGAAPFDDAMTSETMAKKSGRCLEGLIARKYVENDL